MKRLPLTNAPSCEKVLLALKRLTVIKCLSDVFRNISQPTDDSTPPDTAMSDCF